MNRIIMAALTLVVGVAAGALCARMWPPSPEIASAKTAFDEDKLKVADKPKDAVLRISVDQIDAEKITTASLTVGTVAEHVGVPGTIVTDADHIARVPARVVGTVVEMRKRLGDTVRANEVVAVLDSREVADAKSEFLTASVNLDLQRTLHGRAKDLWEKRVMPENQYLQVRNTFSEASLRADLARQKLSALGIDAEAVTQTLKTPSQDAHLRSYELRSPIAGRVVERKVDVGSAVGKEGEPSDVYTVADLTTLWIDIAVPTAEIAHVKEGAQVSFFANGDEAPRSAEGRVVFVGPILNQETRTARVIASFANPGLAWRPGTFVNAEIALRARPPSLLVPRAAVQSINGTTKVFVRTPQGFEVREVRLGVGDDRAFEVVSGVNEGDGVAVGNSFLLKAELGKADAEGD